MNAAAALPPSILDSTRPAVAIAPPGFILVSQAEWDELHARLRAHTPGVPPPVISKIVHGAVRQAAALFNVTELQIRGRLRTARITDIRRAIIHVLMAKGFDHHDISQALNRHESTIRHLAVSTPSLLEIDRNLRAMCSQLLLACS